MQLHGINQFFKYKYTLQVHSHVEMYSFMLWMLIMHVHHSVCVSVVPAHAPNCMFHIIHKCTGVNKPLLVSRSGSLLKSSSSPNSRTATIKDHKYMYFSNDAKLYNCIQLTPKKRTISSKLLPSSMNLFTYVVPC